MLNKKAICINALSLLTTQYLNPFRPTLPKQNSMYLFLDTETSDLPRNWNAPETDTKNWPRLVQLAWVTADKSGSITDSQVHLIKPQGFKIAASAQAIHGISTKFASENGVELALALNEFLQAADGAKTVIAHNIDFDLKIIGAEFIRTAMANPLRKKKLRCTMKESTNYCGIPSSRGFKWPTLEELHHKLFGTGLTQAHDASADCLACLKCYFRLKELKVLK